MSWSLRKLVVKHYCILVSFTISLYGSAAAQWLKPKQHSTRRLVPPIGMRADTIHWPRDEIARLSPIIEREHNIY